MKRVNIWSGILAVFFFVVPTLLYPVRGSVGAEQISFSYGFLFKWITFHFTAQGGRVFFFEALFTHDQGMSLDFITAILNLVILFIAIRAVLVVFGRRRRQYLDHRKPAPDAEDSVPEEPSEEPSSRSL